MKYQKDIYEIKFISEITEYINNVSTGNNFKNFNKNLNYPIDCTNDPINYYQESDDDSDGFSIFE